MRAPFFPLFPTTTDTVAFSAGTGLVGCDGLRKEGLLPLRVLVSSDGVRHYDFAVSMLPHVMPPIFSDLIDRRRKLVKTSGLQSCF